MSQRSVVVLAVGWGTVALIALALFAAPVAAQHQVRTEDGHVIDIEKDLVRIDSGSDVVTVEGDWRKQGTVYTDTELEKVVIELGGAVASDRIHLNLAGDVLFGFDSVEVTAEAAAQLRQAAAVIRSRAAGEVHIIGHTDAKGAADYNAKLSRDRALAVMRWLSRNEKIPTTVLVGRGVGAKYPVAPNQKRDGSDNPDGRARNRRVEIQFGTRAGVTITPGLGALGDGTITTNEASIDSGGVTTGEARIDIGPGGVVITEHDDDDDDDDGGQGGGGLADLINRHVGTSLEGGAKKAPASGSACDKLCGLSAGKHSLDTIGCVEGTLEELGYDFDAGACNDLEGAMALGVGNEDGKLCKSCRTAEGFGESDCKAVIKACFPGN